MFECLVFDVGGQTADHTDENVSNNIFCSYNDILNSTHTILVVWLLDTDVVVGPALHVTMVVAVFPKHRTLPANLPVDECLMFELGKLEQAGGMFAASQDGDFFVQTQSGSAGAVAVGKDMQVGYGQAVDIVNGLCEFLLVLAVETCNHIGGNTSIWHRLLDGQQFAAVQTGVVTAMHQLKHVV